MKKGRTGKNLIILLLVMLPLLIGAKFLDLELRNVKGDPLVDMTLLVNGNSVKAQPADPDADYEGQEEEKPAESEASVRIINDKKKSVAIRVSKDQVYIDNQLIVGKPFEKSFEEIYKSGMSVEVTDDYGDYRAMKKVLDYLDEAGIFYSKKETR